MTQRNCPKCGDSLGPQFARLKMMNCPSCGTSLFVQDDQMRLAGEQGVMHDVPLLFGLGDRVVIGGLTYHPVGHARYSYGRGTWDEFWTTSDTGAGRWISVDEGDVVVQEPLDGGMPAFSTPPALGSAFRCLDGHFTVTEAEEATCVALRGNFPDLLLIGEVHHFINATAADATLLSGEFGPDGARWFLGEWVDPFDVRVDRR
ncbi:DUF4178 domain-containing protein [Fertoebacter nigrum]|uniref:DUF4178 domain-containing protein n=2 Tax=Fertoeibacter niger TaxID=2656921 RepID=A0A8X8H196_9RHOB|nr:DUF4178 domain-containing protein [Fertoeibacter niger]